MAKILEKRNVDFAFFYNSDSSRCNPNMFYFCGYKGLGALIIPRDKTPILVVPEMEFEKAKKSAKGFFRFCKMEKKRFFESIREAVKESKIRANAIAIDKNNFSLNPFKYFKKQFAKSRIIDLSSDCLKLREIKNDAEINSLKKSCMHADKILQKAVCNFKDFKTESDVAAFLEYDTRKLGLETSFNPIVASGSNGSMPHYEPSRTKIKRGFCVIDFGVKYNGYCSDITRTIFVGKPSRSEKQMYDLLHSIQNESIEMANENLKCSKLYDFVLGRLGRYKANFTHGLGHGVGVEIHELPNLTLNSKDRIKNKMVFTIEPGVYFPKRFGIRIEDTILFERKPIALTKTSKDFIVI